MMLESNNYHVESTIEQCLAMSGAGSESEVPKAADLIDLKMESNSKRYDFKL